jgi:hypothetical protein
MTTLIHDLIAMSHDIALFAAVGKIQQNTADLWVKTVEEAVNSLEWKSIETAPQEGEFLIWGAHGIPWPAYASEGKIYSRAHGIVNDPCDIRSFKATHWKPLPAPPEAIATAMQKESEVTK